MKKRHLFIGVGAITGFVVWKVLSRIDTIDWDAVNKYVPHSDKSNFITVDGIRMHYQRFSNEAARKTIILIHGYNSSCLVWKTVAPLFAEKGFEVIAVDLIGFGFSQKPDWFEYSIDSQARMLIRFMNRIGLGKAIVIGSSYGGAVAASMALDYPERIEKLILVSPVCNNKPLSHPLMRMARVPVLAEVISALLVDSRSFIKWRMKNALSPSNYGLISKERIEMLRMPIRAKDSQSALIATARRWDANRIQEDAHLISQPTLILWGEDDKVIDISNARRLYEDILNSRLVIFKNCGHLPQEEKPNDFVEVVTSFLSDRKESKE